MTAFITGICTFPLFAFLALICGALAAVVFIGAIVLAFVLWCDR